MGETYHWNIPVLGILSARIQLRPVPQKYSRRETGVDVVVVHIISKY